METLTLIKKAIREQKAMSFTYDMPDKASGTRFGNPHAIFRVSSKSGRRSTKVHIVQTGGVSENEKLSPKSNFIVFDIRYINNVQVKSKQDSFEIDHRYNPNLFTYQDLVQKI
ncbi:MAG: hypothetical protein ACI9QC_000096 [Oceanicoccus sp.]|jgi:hypothetical protein